MDSATSEDNIITVEAASKSGSHTSLGLLGEVEKSAATSKQDISRRDSDRSITIIPDQSNRGKANGGDSDGTSPVPGDDDILDGDEMAPLIKIFDMKGTSGPATEKTFRSLTSDETVSTMADPANAPERIDPATGEPQDVDPSLDCQPFHPEHKGDHASSLSKILDIDHNKMSAKQKDLVREHIGDFVAFYAPLSTFNENSSLAYNAEIIDKIFVMISDETHPALDKIFAALVILSRNSKSKGPNGGEEPRVIKVLNVLKGTNFGRDVAKECVRSLINYAEVNSKVIYENGGLDILLGHFSSRMHDPSFLGPLLWVLRNMSVTDVCRKVILEKLGFLIVNALNFNASDLVLVENACWTLGNLALSPDSGGLFLAIGAVVTVKSSLVANVEKENVVEAALWFFYNISFDTAALKTFLKIPVEEPIINAFRRFTSNRRIVEWAEVVIKRIRALAQANSPYVIAEKNSKRTIKSGTVKIESGILRRWKPKYAILQPLKLSFMNNEGSTEVESIINLKEVTGVTIDDSNSTRVKLSTRVTNILIECPDKESQKEWLHDLKDIWKMAVSAVTENPSSPTDKSPNGFSFMLPAVETILEEDLEKTCHAIIFHEVYSHPSFLVVDLKSQKILIDYDVWDYLATKFTKETAIEFLSSQKEQMKTPEKENYDVDSIKKALTSIVEEKLMKFVDNFERDPKIEDAPPVLVRYEYNAKQGIRPTMEDKHIHLPYIDLLVGRDKKEEPASYFAVYDGHGGVNVASFVETHLHQNILRHPDFEEDTKKAIVESFTKTQASLKENGERQFQQATAGSTAVTILFKGKKMYVAWAGDSLASIFTKKKDLELVDPHKPGKPSEKARIESLGGFVAEEAGVMRVNGAVAVSRAFGNLRHRVIVPDADVVVHDLTGDEEYIVLACDGLWDVMTTADVRKFVTRYLKKNGKKTKGISEALVDESLRLGSTDNVSVVFIEFNWWKTPKRV